MFTLGPQGLVRSEPYSDDSLPASALWIDLLEPTGDEEKRIELAYHIDVPTREEMREIESSNRLYEENGALYMTATVVTKLDSDLPESTQVTFILTDSRLVTNRYVDPLPFRRYVAYAERHASNCNSGAAILAGLLEAIINRIADVIERVGSELDGISARVFAPPRRKRDSRGRGVRSVLNYREILEHLGQNGETISKARESLVSLGRLLAFAQQQTSSQLNKDVLARLRTLSRDTLAMSDHASYLGNKINFLLDATLGMVNIDQNNILKIFSVVTVFLLPPSVIGAMYGMNFSRIPLAESPAGFWVAVGLMVASSIAPYLVFKRRGWL